MSQYNVSIPTCGTNSTDDKLLGMDRAGWLEWCHQVCHKTWQVWYDVLTCNRTIRNHVFFMSNMLYQVYGVLIKHEEAEY